MADDGDLSSVDVIASLQRLSTPEAVDITQVVHLGGVPQLVSIRGKHRTNPVLVFVHGGPGAPLMPTTWMWQRPVEEFFTVVHYDQRGAGRSFQLSDPEAVRDTLHLAQYAQDVVELVEWLRGELAVEQVVIAGHSWGTLIATQAVLDRPDLFSAYLGVGQVVDILAGERDSYAAVCAEARRRDDVEAIAALDALAPYPGEDGLDLQKLGVEREWVERYGGFAAGRADCDYFSYGEAATPGFTDEDRASTEAGGALTSEVVLPQLVDMTFTDVTTFPVPIVQFLGRHDQMTPAGPVVRWMEGLTAPAKVMEWFEDSAHMHMYEEPGHFLQALLTHVLPHARPPAKSQ